MSTTVQNKLLITLDKLRAAGVHTSLRRDRDDAVSIDVAVPGARWEVDVLSDGSVEIEVFKSDGEIGDEQKLDQLISEQERLNQGGNAA
ncbi:MAG: hypothetical protein ACE37H_15890 [Phycisphaeraceae bacterium]